jgi:hypothetical protein
MAFTPSTFLSHIRSKDGPARPCRFEVILPIPPCIKEFVSTSALDQLLNLPTAIFTDVTDAVNNALGKDRLGSDGIKKDGDESDSIRPQYKGGSPLALETKGRPNPNQKMFNDIKNQHKQMIFESDIRGNSLLDESQIRE